MDAEEALFLLDVELTPESSLSLSREDLTRFAEAVAASASLPEGYSGKTWQHGTVLLKASKRAGLDPARFFDSFGWRALANGIRAGLANNSITSALSYADAQFASPSSGVVLDHPIIQQTIRQTLETAPHPTVSSAELAACSPVVQAEFCALLDYLVHLPANPTLCLQWSASALRVIPSHATTHLTAARCFLQALLDCGRHVAAYYSFRALAEQHVELWNEAIALSVFRAFAVHTLHTGESAHAALVQLCTDDDVLRNSTRQFDLIVMIGVLSIFLAKFRGIEAAENSVWWFISDMHNSFSLVGHALGEYFTSSKLPEHPPRRVEQTVKIEEAWKAAIQKVERELRTRQYDGVPLAIEIYQQNVQKVFLPLLTHIRSQRLPDRFLEQIQGLDPRDLVVSNELQLADRYPIEGKLLRKMISDNKKILQAIESAAELTIDLKSLRSTATSEPDENSALFVEFESMLDVCGSTAKWAFETFLPKLWKHFADGVEIVQKEGEFLNGAR